jgi:hypothetical protein
LVSSAGRRSAAALPHPSAADIDGERARVEAIDAEDDFIARLDAAIALNRPRPPCIQLMTSSTRLSLLTSCELA